MSALARRLRAVLLRIWRRIAHCRFGEHRETAECAFGVMQLRCVDCQLARPLGWVYLHASNKKPHPWERAE